MRHFTTPHSLLPKDSRSSADLGFARTLDRDPPQQSNPPSAGTTVETARHRADLLQLGILPLACLVVFLQLSVPSAEAQRITPRPAPGRQPEIQTVTPTPTDTPSAAITEWEVIHLGDQRIGYAHQTHQTVSVKGRVLHRTQQHMEMRFKRFGDIQTIRVDATFEDWDDGTIHSFRMDFGDKPTRMTHIQGASDGRFLRIETTLSNRTTKSTQRLTPDLRSPAYEQHAYRSRLKQPGDRVRFQMFKPEMGRTVETVLDAQRMTSIRGVNGRSIETLQVQMTQPQLPSVRVFVDREGRVVRTESELFGKALTTFAVTAEEALKSIAGAELDQAVTTLIPTERIRRPHETSRVVYEVQVQDSDPRELFPSSVRQAVELLESDVARLTVTVPEKQPGDAVSVEPGPEHLTASVLVQIDNYHVRDLARKAAAGRRGPADIARLCEEYVQRHIRSKNFSTALASAAEVAQSLEGDCTEHAILLAALLRVHKIPSRVVTGLVYSEHNGLPVFVGHMWTEAWIDGRWQAYDATLGRDGIAAAHLEVSRSNLSDNSPTAATLFLPMFRLFGKTTIRVVEIQHERR